MKHHKFAYYAKNRKLFIRFSVVLFSSLMLILFSLFMQIRVFETKKEHNEDLYGSWYASVYDVTKENENMLYDHQMLDTIGKMSVYGQVQYNDEYAGNIGIVDDSFYEISNISLKTGKLPSRPEEIASKLTYWMVWELIIHWIKILLYRSSLEIRSLKKNTDFAVSWIIIRQPGSIKVLWLISLYRKMTLFHFNKQTYLFCHLKIILM